MTPQMHIKLATWCKTFYSGQISDKNWELIQIHMAYCNDCREAFLRKRQIVARGLHAIGMTDRPGESMSAQSTRSMFKGTSWLGALCIEDCGEGHMMTNIPGLK